MIKHNKRINLGKWYATSNAITLISLVITIIILLILAGVTINLILSKNGIFSIAEQAREETLIAQYKEKIEEIKLETKLKYNNEVTLEKIKNAFDNANQKYWVNNTEIINDNSIEKIKLTTNDGYIFYITEDTTEYKGKNEIIWSNINANMVEYNANWNGTTITTVEEALNYLYTQLNNN